MLKRRRPRASSTLIAGDKDRPVQVFVEGGTIEDPPSTSIVIVIGMCFIYTAGILILLVTIAP